MFKRFMTQIAAGLPAVSRQGDGIAANCSVVVVTADANDTVTVSDIAGGVLQYTGFTAGRTLTTDTAVNILAAAPDMDIGDSFLAIVSIVPAFAGTWAAGAGVTLAGRATTPASSYSIVVITKLTATTVEWRVL